MMQGVYVVADLGRLLLRYLDAQRLEATQVRRTLAGIPQHGRMSMQLWWSLLEQIQTLQPVPALGLRIGQHVKPEDSGVLGYLIMHCDTLGDALLRFQRYQSLLQNFSRLHLHASADRLRMSWDVDQGLSTQLSDEVFMSGLLRFVRDITGDENLAPLAVHFNHAVAYSGEAYEELLGCPVSFAEPRVAVEIPRDALGRQLDSHDPYLLSLLDRQASALLDNDQTTDPLIEQLRQVIVSRLSQGPVNLELAAADMLLSSRTLHRRLQQRGQNFNQVLRSTREQLTRMYLADPKLNLQDVAFLLGYAEQSAFSRACRQWFGVSPKLLRRKLLGQTAELI